MYSTCLFCSRSLGRNEVVETFPVGRRLAFDASKGRLWVVCTNCERWNLTPMEERWEAIETCDRLFRDTRLRVSTDQIGLAKLREGLVLVRIDSPQRPEFAAWRYGDRFGRRRYRQTALTGLGVVAAGGVAVGLSVTGAALAVAIVKLATFKVAYDVGARAVRGRPTTVVTAIRSPTGTVANVTRADLATAKLVPGQHGDPFGIRITTDLQSHLVHGPAATSLDTKLLPHVNRFGGTRSDVAQAVSGIEAVGSPHAYLSKLVQHRARQRQFRVNRLGGDVGEPADALTSLTPVERVAVEMAVHEEQERRALEGELAELERAWQDAEEIAGIADNLLLPPSVESILARLRHSF